MRRRDFFASALSFSAVSTQSNRQKAREVADGGEVIEWIPNNSANKPPIDTLLYIHIDGRKYYGYDFEPNIPILGYIESVTMGTNNRFYTIQGWWTASMNNVTHWAVIPKPPHPAFAKQLRDNRILKNKIKLCVRTGVIWFDGLDSSLAGNAWVISSRGLIECSYFCSRNDCWVDTYDNVIERVYFWRPLQRKPQFPILKTIFI